MLSTCQRRPENENHKTSASGASEKDVRSVLQYPLLAGAAHAAVLLGTQTERKERVHMMQVVPHSEVVDIPLSRGRRICSKHNRCSACM